MRNRIDSINIFLIIVLLTIVVIYFLRLSKDLFFEKQIWYMAVNSKFPEGKVDSESPDFKSYPVQVIGARFGNDRDSRNAYERPFAGRDSFNIINESWYKYLGDLYDVYSKELYPNIFTVEWFAFNEGKFYSISQKISYEKVKKYAERLKKSPDDKLFVCATILPEGKLMLSAGLNLFDKEKNKDPKFYPFDTITAQVINKNWEILKNKDASLKNIKQPEDYTSLINKKYRWNQQIDIPAHYERNGLSFETFDDHSIDTTNEYRSLPKTLWVAWSDQDVDYNTTLTFDANELQTDFRKLEQNPAGGTIRLVCKINMEKPDASVFLTKGGTTISLGNIIKTEINQDSIETEGDE
jgi:hypothetical protein